MKNLKPITRQETLLAKVAGQDVPDLEPITREEFFLAKAAGKDVPTIEPITREEYFLADVIEAIESGGGGSDLGTKTISANGVYKASDDSLDGYSKVTVNVPASAVDSGTKNISSNGSHDVTGYASASVSVPNSYSAGDEGKVVSNGALVAQSSDTVTENDTYDTTTISSLTVNVSGGGGITADEIAMESAPTGAVTLTATEIKAFAFYGKPITSIYAPNIVKMDGRAFEKTNIVNLNDPFPAMAPSTSTLLNTAAGYIFGNMPSLKRVYMTNTGTWCARLDTFVGCSELVVLRLPNQDSNNTEQRVTSNCRKLKVVDYGKSRIWSNSFNGCYLFDTLILRNSSVQALGNTSAFSNTPFRGYNGLSGTVYVPSALIESYKTETNWSTMFSEGHCNFAALEGSPYEQIDWDDSALWQ